MRSAHVRLMSAILGVKTGTEGCFYTPPNKGHPPFLPFWGFKSFCACFHTQNGGQKMRVFVPCALCICINSHFSQVFINNKFFLTQMMLLLVQFVSSSPPPQSLTPSQRHQEGKHASFKLQLSTPLWQRSPKNDTSTSTK